MLLLTRDVLLNMNCLMLCGDIAVNPGTTESAYHALKSTKGLNVSLERLTPYG